jgi:aarF domain-containing kinase
MWNERHVEGAQKMYETIANLKGFYVKTAQIISSRQDLFPKQYTDALSGFTDNLDPMPASLAKAVVKQELLNSMRNLWEQQVSPKSIGLCSATNMVGVKWQ